MRNTLALSLALLALATPSAAATDAARIVAAKRALERAVYAKTPDALVRARAEFEGMSAASPKSALLHYWVAVADWRIAPRVMDNKEQAARFVSDGIHHADEASRLAPKMAEPSAIKGSLQGLSISLDPSTMMSAGVESEANLQRALTLGPTNPRVWLLDAMGTLHKPAFVGGGADQALPKFKKAEELFAKETVADSTAPDWGRFEVAVWTGRTYAQLGDVDSARDAYAKALAIQPDNGWVKNVLLPDLEKSRTTGVPEAGTKVKSAPAPAPDTASAPKGGS